MAPIAGNSAIPVLLSLGSNIDNPIANLKLASTLLRPHLREVRISAIYQTEPLDYLDQPVFYNLMLYGEVPAAYPVTEFFRTCQNIEREMTRVKKIKKGPRNIDIDIILYGSLNKAIVLSPEAMLIVPHPRYLLRMFVLQPLMELEEVLGRTFPHPVLGLTASEVLVREPWQSILAGQGIKKIKRG